MTIFSLLASFFKVGTIGFGGGSALIPIIHKEIVTSKKALSEDDYLKHTVIANVTPGALPVKLGASCGFQLSNPLGSVASAYAVALPGVFATVLIIALFSMMGQTAIDYLNFASVGITIFIVYLLLHYVISTVSSGNARINMLICFLAMLLTMGKEVREIAELAFGLSRHSLGVSLCNLSMIHVMIIAFFLIYHFLLSKGSVAKIVPGIILAAAYAVLSGATARERWAGAGTWRLIVAGLFVVDIVVLWLAFREEGGKRAVRLRRSILVTILLFLLLPFIPVVAGVVLGHFPEMEQCLAFLSDILLSTVASFGGGEAYVAVADSVFVQGGYCEPEVFYGRIVPVANALPGPILIKVATALGFVWAQAKAGYAAGILLAAACMMLSIGACSSLALLVLNYYDALKDSPFILSLKKFILPVICGTLISTSLSMLYESMKILSVHGFRPMWTFLTMVVCVGVTFWLYARYRLHDLVMLLGWIVVSLGFILVSLGRI